MKRMISSLALGAVLAFVVNAAVAQSGDTPPPPGGGGWHHPMDPASQAEHLTRRLSLSSEQQTQVQSILTASQAQMKTLDANESLTRAQFREQMKALHESSEAKIEAILNDTQKQQYAEMKARRQQHEHGPDGGDGPPPPPQE